MLWGARFLQSIPRNGNTYNVRNMSSFIRVVNPATEFAAKIPSHDKAQIIEMAQNARKNQAKWAATPLNDRVSAIKKFGQLLQERKDSLAEVLSADMGKPLKQAKGEISATVGRVNFFTNTSNLEAVLKPRICVSEGPLQEHVTVEPLGVVANISAWNFPYFVGSNVILPALVTGNAVLYKPSEITARTGIEIGNLLHEAGIPKPIFQVIIGDGSAGSVLLDESQDPTKDRLVDGVFFTGSLKVGKIIAAKAGSAMMHAQLELGGKDAAYVAEDADPISAAAALADGAMYNAGQSCCSVERIYVHESLYEKFVTEVVKEVKGMRVGDPLNEDTYMGPLARGDQINVLKTQIAEAVAGGAKVLTGGNPIKVNGKGFFFEPTVVVNCKPDMQIVMQESFGPVVPILSVKNDAEALEHMNRQLYGLTSAIYTKSEQRAKEMGEKLNTGTIYWNCCDRVSPHLPWSGRKGSGIGSTLGLEGIRAFVRPKAWHMKNPA